MPKTGSKPPAQRSPTPAAKPPRPVPPETEDKAVGAVDVKNMSHRISTTARRHQRRDLEDPVAARWNAVVAVNLRRLRLATGLSIAGLAHRVGFSTPLVQQHENGRSRLNAGQAKVYADALGVQIEALFAPVNAKDLAGLRRDRP